MGDRTVQRDLDLFSGVTAEDVAQLITGCEELDVEPGEIVVREGRHDHEFYVILEGRAEVVRDGSVLVTLGPGQFFGEGALLSGGPRNASVQACSGMRVLVVPEALFRDLLDRAPAFSDAVRDGADGRTSRLEANR
jgi:CRP-like cAMP-binding protein